MTFYKSNQGHIHYVFKYFHMHYVFLTEVGAQYAYDLRSHHYINYR